MQEKNADNLIRETKRRHWLLRSHAGFTAMFENPKKGVILICGVLLVVFLWMELASVLRSRTIEPFATIASHGMAYLLPAIAVISTFTILVLMGTPRGAHAISNDLRRAGVTNRAGEAPLLVSRQQDQENENITILEFETAGISRTEWEDKQSEIETALNVYVARIEESDMRSRIRLFTVSSDGGLPSVIYWKENDLSPDSFVLTLGKGLVGPVSVNLAHIPHILLGGSTGSGKSVLLKLLLMQCIKKGAKVYIADFKGGVDFGEIWHEKCKLIFDKAELLEFLSHLVEELEYRKVLFRHAQCPNIDEYNSLTGKDLHRLIFACDEIAEVLDKTGLSKDDKELVMQLESKLSVIARQGRAFGIHLIIATQRPDANILTGQIKNNIDCRVCGRADKVLSQIILDCTDAAELIPKNARGRFLLHDGTIFQGYLFDEQSWTG